MKCDRCVNSRAKTTGVPSCWLPRCIHDKGMLLEEYRRLATHMPRDELRMSVLEQEIRQRIHEEVGERWFGEYIGAGKGFLR